MLDDALGRQTSVSGGFPGTDPIDEIGSRREFGNPDQLTQDEFLERLALCRRSRCEPLMDGLGDVTNGDALVSHACRITAHPAKCC